MRLFILLAAICLSLASCSSSKPDDSTTVFTVNQNEDSVAVIKPTFAQGQHYAYKSGNGVGIGIAIACIALFIGVLILLADGKIQMGAGPGCLMLGLLLGAIAGFAVKGSRVWLNNDKEIPIAEYRDTLKQHGDSQAIWDKYYEENRLIDAPSK